MTTRPTSLVAASVRLCECAHRGETVLLDIAPELSGGANSGLRYDRAFTGAENGETALALLDAWGGEAERLRSLGAFEAPGPKIRGGDRPAELRLAHESGARIDQAETFVQQLAPKG